MKLVLHFLSAIAIAAAGISSASANDVTKTIDVTGMSAQFDALHVDDADFGDLFTFDVTGSVLATAAGITIDLDTNPAVHFTSVSLNGDALKIAVVADGYVEFFYTPEALPMTGPLLLAVDGTTTAGNGVDATYGGVLKVSPVPEPETSGLLILGVGCVAMAARRRRLAFAGQQASQAQ